MDKQNYPQLKKSVGGVKPKSGGTTVSIKTGVLRGGPPKGDTSNVHPV